MERPINSRLCKYEKTLPPITNRENILIKFNTQLEPKSNNGTKTSEISVKNNAQKFESEHMGFIKIEKPHETKSDSLIQLAIVLPNGVRINDNFEINKNIEGVIKQVLTKASEFDSNASECYLIQMPNEVINDLNRTLYEYKIKNRSSLRLIWHKKEPK